MKKIFLCLLCLVILSACSEGTPPSTETIQDSNELSSQIQDETLVVSSSIVPLSSLIATIGGEYVEVNTIVPAGVSPHGFDLSARQMGEIVDSEKLFLVGLEHIDGFLETTVSEDKQVHLADGMELIQATAHDHDEHEEEKHNHDIDDSHGHDDHGHDDEEHTDDENDGHDTDVHDLDPHVWLGRDNVITMANIIRDELSELLPKQADVFQTNTETFVSNLNQLYADFDENTTGKTPQEFIVFHDAYNYLMQSIGMDLDLKIAFSENVLSEPGTGHIIDLIEEIELHEIKYMFQEPQFQSEIITKFANDYDLTLLTLDPLGTDPNAGGYLSNIESNLTALSRVYE